MFLININVADSIPFRTWVPPSELLGIEVKLGGNQLSIEAHRIIMDSPKTMNPKADFLDFKRKILLSLTPKVQWNAISSKTAHKPGIRETSTSRIPCTHHQGHAKLVANQSFYQKPELATQCQDGQLSTESRFSISCSFILRNIHRMVCSKKSYLNRRKSKLKPDLCSNKKG